ncbi:MAG TPA: hypothetical protein ENN08_00280 [Bacteroidales bacterium]|nr:hypothetical protein [Bacteroidales bacterium]
MKEKTFHEDIGKKYPSSVALRPYVGNSGRGLFFVLNLGFNLPLLAANADSLVFNLWLYLIIEQVRFAGKLNIFTEIDQKTLKYYEAHLPPDSFIRIHRKYIANLSFDTSVELYKKNTHLVNMKNGDKIRTSQEGYKRMRMVF